MNPLVPHLILASVLFATGMAGALARKNAILVLVGIELMLNAGNLSFVSFWRYGPNPDPHTGILFALFSIAIAAAEAAVGLALIIAMFRHRRTTQLDAIQEMKG